MFYASLNQMLVLATFILAGFVLSRAKVLPEQTARVLAKLENTLLIPALALGTFVENFTVQKLRPSLSAFLVGCVTCLAMIPISVLLARGCEKDDYLRRIYTYGLSFSNFGFMGNAVVQALFPEMFPEHLIFTLPSWIAIYLWGVPCLLMRDAGGQTRRERLRALCNPMLIALLLGMAIGLSGLRLPAFLLSAVDTCGSCMSPVAMLLVGVTVANLNWKQALSRKSIYAVTFLRLVVYPLLYVGLFALIPAPQTIVRCTVCCMAMPLGLNTIVIPSAYGRDTSAATGMALVSHLLSVATIPGVLALLP